MILYSWAGDVTLQLIDRYMNVRSHWVHHVAHHAIVAAGGPKRVCCTYAYVHMRGSLLCAGACEWGVI